MDKNFDYIACMVNEKKKRKDENLQKRYFLTEVLDHMDKISHANQVVEGEVENVKAENAAIFKENKVLQKELDKINEMIKKTKATMDTERAKLKETQLIPQKYAVDKLQRELEESRVVCEETLYKQKIELSEKTAMIVDAEQDLMDLQHECRNSILRLNKQAKKLKEKSNAINWMVHNQDEIRTSSGKVVLKDVTKDSSLAGFHERIRRIANSK
mmetsp:Transcript_2891/g.3565  ORF Transcript_2891/g.3565 Transcript_2891/m.3565 type:complete len:214 (-) Transcript_2891:37-678(-)